MEVKRKSDKEIVNTDLVTKWSGQPDETGKSGGQTPIKIKLKRLASPLRPRAIYGNSRPLHPTSEHNPADMYSHKPHGEPSVISPAMEAILPSCPSMSTESQDIVMDSKTTDTHGYAGNPDSTSDIQPYVGTEGIDDAQTGIHNEVDQMQKEEVDSSSYRIISM